MGSALIALCVTFVDLRGGHATVARELEEGALVPAPGSITNGCSEECKPLSIKSLKHYVSQFGKSATVPSTAPCSDKISARMSTTSPAEVKTKPCLRTSYTLILLRSRACMLKADGRKDTAPRASNTFMGIFRTFIKHPNRASSPAFDSGDVAGARAFQSRDWTRIRVGAATNGGWSKKGWSRICRNAGVYLKVRLVYLRSLQSEECF